MINKRRAMERAQRYAVIFCRDFLSVVARPRNWIIMLVAVAALTAMGCQVKRRTTELQLYRAKYEIVTASPRIVWIDLASDAKETPDFIDILPYRASAPQSGALAN